MSYLKLAFTTAILCMSQPAWSQTLPGSDLLDKTFEMNIKEIEAPTLSLEELEAEINFMNGYIGSYPPRFKNEAERQKIYEKWLILVAEAEAYAKANKGSEASFYLRSEFYRQGHNMDVVGSAEKTFQHINACLKLYETSIPCNFSASYFYLSIGPSHLKEAEKSLATLRAQYKPELDDEVESGYAYLYIYQQDIPKALKQMDYYIENFPNSPRVAGFKQMSSALKDGNFKVVTK